jgi:aminopeptidase
MRGSVKEHAVVIDARWNELAQILVNYSTATKSGDKVLITMMEVDTFPLARAVHAEAIRAGAYPHVEFQSTYLERDWMLYAQRQVMDWVPEMMAKGMEWADVYVGLRGARNPHEFEGIPADVITARKRGLGEISAMRNELTRWVLVRVPNEPFAQQARTSVDEMMEFFFNATLRDWEAEAARYREIREVFQAANEVRIIGLDTDLRFSTKGRYYEVADGHLNMPDGEIFTAPVDDSVEGHIYFEFPGVYVGQEVKRIRLEFKEGQVVSASAESNEELLQRLLEMDEGASRVGEFGVGLNYGIDRFCSDILYDEKIGGTVHIALARAYEECGGVNQSALHWDIVKDLRERGEIHLDGRKIFESGEFLV